MLWTLLSIIIHTQKITNHIFPISTFRAAHLLHYDVRISRRCRRKSGCKAGYRPFVWDHHRHHASFPRYVTAGLFGLFRIMASGKPSNSFCYVAVPRLNRDETRLSSSSAIKKHTQIHEMNFVWLGKTKQPDIVPRIADFALQFGEIYLVCGGG